MSEDYSKILWCPRCQKRQNFNYGDSIRELECPKCGYYINDREREQELAAMAMDDWEKEQKERCKPRGVIEMMQEANKLFEK